MKTQINVCEVTNELERLMLSENIIRFSFEYTHNLTVETHEVNGNKVTFYDLEAIDRDTKSHTMSVLSAIFLCAYIFKVNPYYNGEITKDFLEAFENFIRSHGLVKHFEENEDFEETILRNVMEREVKIYQEHVEWLVDFYANKNQAIELLKSL